MPDFPGALGEEWLDDLYERTEEVVRSLDGEESDTEGDDAFAEYCRREEMKIHGL